MYCEHICPVKSTKPQEELPLLAIILSYSENHLCLWTVISNANLAALGIGASAELFTFERFTMSEWKSTGGETYVNGEGEVLIAKLTG